MNMTRLEVQDRLSHYKAFERQCQEAANLAALTATLAERRYARAAELVREIEKQLAMAKS
jgi:hypothetical protein